MEWIFCSTFHIALADHMSQIGPVQTSPELQANEPQIKGFMISLSEACKQIKSKVEMPHTPFFFNCRANGDPAQPGDS